LLQLIFEQGINKQRLPIAQANQEEFLNTFKKTILNVGQEVSIALFSYQAAVEKQSLREQQFAYLQKSVDYTK
jgi:multidrug efflux system outer membrane protein